jgi:hypothetical protein
MRMLRNLRTHMSFANVTSLLALFIALSGVAWAASLPKNSVGAAQIKTDGVSRSEIKRNAVASGEIKDNDVQNIDVANNAITNGKIADGSVGLADLAPNSVDGSKVVEGALTGADVGDGTLGASDVGAGTFLPGKVTVQHDQAPADLADGAKGSFDAFCLENQVAIAGGVRGDDTMSQETNVSSSRPVISTANRSAPVDNGTFTGWRATVTNLTGGATTGIRPEVWVVCASLP